MKQPFEIRFDFPVAHSNLKFFLKATAELHFSEPYYVVFDFHLENSAREGNEHSVLPPQEIKQVNREGALVWVHKDSERESLLSLAIGRAIEGAVKRHK